MKALPPELVARISIDHLSDAEPAALRELMHKAKFSLVKSAVLGPGEVLVTVTVEMESGSRHQVQTVDVISKLDGAIWKYWGLPKPAKE